MLRQEKENRSLRENLMLASSTAFVSGIVNVVCLLAFLAFSSNVTGHVANLANHVVQQNYHEIGIFLIWLFMFFAGAFAATFIIRSVQEKSLYKANATIIGIEIILMLAAALYAHHLYQETQFEKEVLISLMLFVMGLQNSMVSTISGGLIKTSHLTGLFTDLGGEVAEWFHPKTAKTTVIRNKILIRLTILGFYFIGAVGGGYFFNIYEFAIFYVVPFILLTILYYDLSPIALHKLLRIFSKKPKTSTTI
ncbi:YoaK family protein [Mucilaginibacter ginkgonis]|uniref:DUF1275 domain-containing protein n=1 Tax=Mucilaginibacter ginkgonis TaxID=2682091 RepID=A0A6I4I1M0_9SPHI|nr:YoaK family protein [Mucilaginibacter ginkgonis]QQL50503.1 DUF1275 domain-containing protein [Mucilaginibacter ginkgonis]